VGRVRDRELGVFTHAAGEHASGRGLHSYGCARHNAGPTQTRHNVLIALRGLSDSSHDYGDRL
jgi:hypothetical protein